MSPLSQEIITRKAELVYLHWSFPVVLVCLNALLVWKYFPAQRRVFSVTPKKTWLSVAVYVVVVGIVASPFGFLSHAMFHWSVWQRLPYTIVAFLLALPPVIQILHAVKQEALERRDRSKSAPLLLTAAYFAIAFVFSVAPFTAIE